MELSAYLHQKHLEYCNEVGKVVSEAEWVMEVLNKKLPKSEQLSYASVNQWMSGGRSPDAKNIIRLIEVFGFEIMPYLKINIPSDLINLITDWPYLPDETKEQILKIVDESRKPEKAIA